MVVSLEYHKPGQGASPRFFSSLGDQASLFVNLCAMDYAISLLVNWRASFDASARGQHGHNRFRSPDSSCPGELGG